MLNILWPFFIIISIFYAILSGNIENINNCIFESAENSVKLTLTLLGATCLWSGIMEIASKTDIIKYLSAILQPIIKKIFYNLDSNKKSYNNIIMNIIANILGLGNAATPLGLKAMGELQKENANKDELSDNMMMLIVLNTASLQVIPTTVIAVRKSLGSNNPTQIIFPVWIATVCAAVVGILVAKIIIKLTRN
jgi:spore maturation protein A